MHNSVLPSKLFIQATIAPLPHTHTHTHIYIHDKNGFSLMNITHTHTTKGNIKYTN